MAFVRSIYCFNTRVVPIFSNQEHLPHIMKSYNNFYIYFNLIQQVTVTRSETKPMFVIISCGCCFLQSCIAFGILLPVLYKGKCCVTFLKMQFCTATSTAMAIFMLGLFKYLPEVSLPFFTTCFLMVLYKLCEVCVFHENFVACRSKNDSYTHLKI